MVLLKFFAFATIVGVYGHSKGACITRPLEIATTALGSAKSYCKYEHVNHKNVFTSMMITVGSVFETIDSCTRCRCTEYGLECCGTGNSFGSYTMNPPKECHVIRDGCDEFLVYKSDNITDCITGKQVPALKYEWMMQQKQNKMMDDVMRNWAMEALGIRNGAGRGKHHAQGEYEPGLLQQMKLYDMILRSMETNHMGPVGNVGPAETGNVQPGTGSNLGAPSYDRNTNGYFVDNLLPVLSLVSLFQ